MNLAFDAPINPNGSVKRYDALEVRPFPQKGKLFDVIPFFRCPHDRLLLRFFSYVRGTARCHLQSCAIWHKDQVTVGRLSDRVGREPLACLATSDLQRRGPPPNCNWEGTWLCL